MSDSRLSIWCSALSDAALLKLAGPATFKRSHTYLHNGAISEPELSYPDAVSVLLQADVQGTELYSTRLRVSTDGQIEGDCDCPHADDGYFCKHQVALGLHLRGLLGGGVPELDAEAQKKIAASAKRVQTRADQRTALLQFLHTQTAETLAKKLWEIAEYDRSVMADLKAWRSLSTAKKDDKSLKAALSSMLKTPGFLDWHASSDYVRRAGQILPLLQDALEVEPQLARSACEHALRCLFKVGEHADDSNGAIGDLMQDVMDLLLKAVKADAPAAAWMNDWFKLMEDDPWGLWNAAEVLPVADAALAQAYGERVTRDWRNWCASHPPLAPVKDKKNTVTGYDAFDGDRYELRQRYLAHLQQQGDVLACIEAMRTSAETWIEHSDLIRYCEQQNKMREALQYAQLAHARYPDNDGLISDLLRCYERDGWDAEAYVLRRRRVEKSPLVKNYLAALDSAQAAGLNREQVRAELFAWQIAQEQQAMRHPTPTYGYARRDTGPACAPVVSIRVEWLLAEDQVLEALELAQLPNRCDPALLHTLALRLPVSHQPQALALLLRLFEYHMPAASNPYVEVLTLVREILPHHPDQAAWLASLRLQYKAKRNFIKGLNEL